MKKASLALLLWLALSLILVGCGGGNIQAVAETPAEAVGAAEEAAPADMPVVAELAPMANATVKEPTNESDTYVDQIATQLGYSEYTYEFWQLDAGVAWQDVLSHYQTQAKGIGWELINEQQSDRGEHMAAFGSGNETKMILLYTPLPDQAAIELMVIQLITKGAPPEGIIVTPGTPAEGSGTTP